MTDFHSVSPRNRANFNLPTSLQNSWTSPPMGLYEPALTQRCSDMLVYLNLTCLRFFTYRKTCLAKGSLKYISSSWFQNMIILYLLGRRILHKLVIILQFSYLVKGTSQWSIFVMALLAMICLRGLLALKANQSSVSLDYTGNTGSIIFLTHYVQGIFLVVLLGNIIHITLVCRYKYFK